MALILSKVLPTGVTADYWRVEFLSLDRGVNPVQECLCIIALYLNVDARNAGNEKIASFSFVWNGEENPFNALDNLSANPVLIAYQKLATLPEFEGAAYG